MSKRLKVFEAFAGVGSQSMALRNIKCNYEIVGISDVDKYALIAYDAIHNNNEEIEIKTKEEMLEEIKSKNIGYNFSTGKSEIPKKEEDIRKLYNAHIRNKNFGDIRLIDPNKLPDFNFFTYSFPCKNISVAGQQGGLEEGSGTQSSLIWECKKIIEVKRPEYLMMENVKNIIGKKHKPTLDMWCDILDKMGYINIFPEKGYLNGKDFGVPQNRERVIMISIRKDVISNFKFPKGKDSGIRLKDILEIDVDEKYYILKDKLIIKEEALLHNNSTKNELIQVGMLNIKGNESNRRVYFDTGLCPTLNSMNGGNRQPKVLISGNSKFYDDFKIRKLTPLECWRLMGFDDMDFYKSQEAGLPNSKLYERAGRGIVVPMLEEIFKNLFSEYIGDKNEENNK